jgi:hypothetical protein
MSDGGMSVLGAVAMGGSCSRAFSLSTTHTHSLSHNHALLVLWVVLAARQRGQRLVRRLRSIRRLRARQMSCTRKPPARTRPPSTASLVSVPLYFERREGKHRLLGTHTGTCAHGASFSLVPSVPGRMVHSVCG